MRFSVPEVKGDLDSADSARSSFTAAGLSVVSAHVEYSGKCSGNDGTGTVSGVSLTLQGPAEQFSCPSLRLPVTKEQTVECTGSSENSGPVDAGTADCSMTFEPPL